MSDMWRIVVPTPGGPDAMVRQPLSLADPQAGEARLRITAVGLNFIDTYHRSGLYPLPPGAGLGTEAAALVEAVGEGVTDFRVGDRVGWRPKPSGAYATHANAPIETLIPLPDAISDDMAAASLLKGTTTWMLVEQLAKVAPGQTVLVLAAAGGVGSMAVQWLKHCGATVIAHAGTAEKAEMATAQGADHALSCPIDDLPGQVRSITNGRGVDTVLDGVGAASWSASLASAARRGLVVSYGNASGPVPPLRLLDLTAAGSVMVSRPTVADFIDTPERRDTAYGRLFELLGSGALEVEIGRRYALADVAEAHRALEARETTGSTILRP
jgi:NADPH2:quinone reductase